MVRTKRLVGAFGVVGLAALAIACGGSSGSQFGGDPNANPTGPGDPNQGQFNNDPVGTNAACVTATKNAGLPPVNLVIMFDKSGSMGDPAEGGDPNQRWIPVTTGMKAFFADPQSAGYNASLQFFPAPGSIDATCNAAYATPKVAMTSLANAAPLTAALDSTTPQGGTPTLPALQGAIAYAQQVKQANPDQTTVVLLVTDGDPGMMVNGTFQAGCANNDVSHVAAAAAAGFAAGIPTYVVGIGGAGCTGSCPNPANVNAMAAGGGTSQAFLVSVSDPSTTRTQLQDAFNAIRSQVKVGCDFGLPAPPDGQTLDPTHVNVAYESPQGEQVLTYSADCSAAGGWHYDNPTTPTRVVLCPNMCSTVQANPTTGSLKLAFGCQTKGVTK